MKKIMIVFLILISCLSHAQTINNGQITKNINGLNIIIDKRIEMLSVIKYLAN